MPESNFCWQGRINKTLKDLLTLQSHLSTEGSSRTKNWDQARLNWTKKMNFTRVAKLYNYGKCVVNSTFAQFAQICARAKTDIALDLLSVAMTVNATFAQYIYLHLGAKRMGSHGFKGHLHMMVRMCRQICFFELYLPITQIIAQICCSAQLLL